MNPNHHPTLAAELTRRIAPHFPGIKPAHLLEDVEVEVFTPTGPGDQEAIIHCAYEAEHGWRDDRWGYVTREQQVEETTWADTPDNLIDTLVDLTRQNKTFHTIEIPQHMATTLLSAQDVAA